MNPSSYRAALAAIMLCCNPLYAQTQQETSTENEDIHNEDTIVVTGTRAQGYIVPQTDALGIPLEVNKTPASITILSDDLLEDMGARDLTTIITYIPGLSNADNGGTNRENFRVRGFAQTQTFINGIRQSITSEGIRAIDTIERVQVLKGPSGVEASLTSPGGFVNILTKKPEQAFAAEMFLSAGDFGFARVGGDVTGTLVEDRVTGRLIAAFEQKQFWRDGQDDRPIMTIAPSIDFKLGERTNLLFEYEYVDQDDPLDRGVIYLEGAGLKDNFLPRTFSLHGDDDSLDVQTQRFDVALNHIFNDVFSARLYYQRVEQNSAERSFRNADSEGDGSLFLDDGITFSGNSVIDVFYADFGAQLKSDTLQADVSADFSFGEVRHFINMGIATAQNEDIFTDDDEDFIYGDFVNSFDIFNPNNNQTPVSFGEFVLPHFIRGDEIDSVFVQWLTDWTPRLRTVASVRRDDVAFFEREDISGIGTEALAALTADFAPDPIDLFSDGYSDDIVSYRMGGSYDLTDAVTAFVGFAKTGEPQQGFTRSGNQVNPLTATSLEAGMKWQVAEGRALMTATAYHLKQDDIALSDPTNLPTENFLLPLGNAEISGFEFEVIGMLTDNLSVFGGFAVQESEITASEDDIVGNRFANTPDFQASAFFTYNGAAFNLPGLDTSFGIVHQGEREANSANQYQLPSYTRLDFAVGYSFNNDIELRLNIENLLDKTYYTAAQDSIFGSDQVAVGDRRLFQLTLTKRF